MPLSLLAGPANAGKVALLLERYLDALDSDPILIVPNRPDVDRAERELLTRAGALVGGSIGTFDDLFERIAQGNGSHRPVISQAQRTLLLRRVVAGAEGRSARFSGFADSLGTTVAELESALLEPGELDGELAALYGAYRDAARPARALGSRARAAPCRRAGRRRPRRVGAAAGVRVRVRGPDRRRVGAARGAGRARRGDGLAAVRARPRRLRLALAHGRGPLAPRGRADRGAAAEPRGPLARARASRALALQRGQRRRPELDGSLRFLEGAGIRGTLELVADEILALLRDGTPADEIAIVCPTLDRWRAPLDTAFTTLGVPYALEGRLRLGQTPFGQALLSLLRYAWLDGQRRELFAFLRSPYSGLPRHHVDFLEGRLRGRGVTQPERVEEEVTKLRGQPLPHLDADPQRRAIRSPRSGITRARWSARPTACTRRRSTRPRGSTCARTKRRQKLLAELEGWRDLGGEASREEIVSLLADASVRLAGAGEAGRVAVLDLLRARTRRFEVVFVVGLDEGRLPRRSQGSPFLDEEQKAELERSSRAGRLLRTDPVSRDRYLFYTACTRPTRRLYLVREAASDDGAPRQASPFWDETRGLFAPDDVERWTRRRPLAALTWPLEAAPSERERLRALASLAPADRAAATSLARANGWERRLDRALAAFDRPTRLTHPLVLDQLREKSTFAVTELERFTGCSSMWFVDRVLQPRSIDVEVDARLKGTIVHQALFSFFKGLPKRTGADRVQPETLEDALVFLRECLADALAAHVRFDLPELERNELEQSLARDLEKLIRREAESESPLVPSRFEVSFGSERSAPELQRGLDLGGFAVTGKIDRIDRDPFGARGIVVDYKSGRAPTAREIDRELHLQIPLYMLVLRDLVGIEPLGGVYRTLAGDARARGLLRAEAREDGLQGFMQNDYVEEDDFWGGIERAREHAVGVVERIREGDVRHDPRGGSCPTWCELWPMCRVKRS